MGIRVGGNLLKFKGGEAEPVPRDSGSRRETDTVTDPALGNVWFGWFVVSFKQRVGSRVRIREDFNWYRYSMDESKYMFGFRLEQIQDRPSSIDQSLNRGTKPGHTSTAQFTLVISFY